mmetsp:Transcript_11234/g.12724  ORF Transcript_11234/g.12724 Transcript_11234/m.12724 type:complete len:102 (-) Transcript_11234:173-478(-)
MFLQCLPTGKEGRETGSNNNDRQCSDILCVRKPIHTVYGWDKLRTYEDLLQRAWRNKNGQQKINTFVRTSDYRAGKKWQDDVGAVVDGMCTTVQYLRFHSH